jgi:hypothetical protein
MLHFLRLVAACADRCDSPFRYSLSITGYSRVWTNARHRLLGITVAGAALATEPGILAFDFPPTRSVI